MTARAQQNLPMSPPRPHELRKPNRMLRKSNSSKKLRKPDAKLESLRHEPNNSSQKGKSKTTKQNSHKPTKKLSLPPLTQKRKNLRKPN
jgi:hypothetical protein